MKKGTLILLMVGMCVLSGCSNSYLNTIKTPIEECDIVTYEPNKSPMETGDTYYCKGSFCCNFVYSKNECWKASCYDKPDVTQLGSK